MIKIRSVLFRRVIAFLLVAGISSAVAATGSKGIPNRSVTYTAHTFMRGMRVTVPTPAWKVYQDRLGEFNLIGPSGTHIHFWLDPQAITPDNTVVPGVRTPAALVAWLRSQPDLVVSAPVIRRIVGNLRARSVDLDVSATAPSDPTCGGPCLDYFNFAGRGYKFSYGTGHGHPIRLYFGSLRRSSNQTTHTFTISVDTPSPQVFRAVTTTAQGILRSVRLPATWSVK